MAARNEVNKMEIERENKETDHEINSVVKIKKYLKIKQDISL